MVNPAGRLALKSALFAKRKRLGRAARGKTHKPTKWLYPWATERRYAKAIKAWIKPMIDYVHEYLKNNQEAILRGDSAALMKQDTTPGGSYRRMVKSLYGWYTMYFPPVTESGTRDSPPIVFMGLGSIADSLADFNGEQWNKAAKAELGVEFPVYESWWPETKQAWQEDNYRLIQSMGADYIKRVNIAAEKAVTSGMSVGQLAKEIHKIDGSLKSWKVNLIARDQIGKLNGQVTQARMEAIGLELYEWSTSSDERVRDSHAELEGMICRWDDPTVYSDDEGKTWKDRPSDWSQVHPGYDIQCRCTALSYWAELVNEVDREIDIEEGILIHDPGDENETASYPEDPKLNEMIKEFENREGQKIKSITAETKYIRDMGIAAGNKIEFGTFTQDGVIMQAIKGKSSHVPVSDELEARILEAPDNSVVIIHYHPSGASFSLEDIGTFSEILSFSEMRITTADGLTYVMSINEDSQRPSAEKLNDDYINLIGPINNMLMPQVRTREITMDQKRILESRYISQTLAKMYNWDYMEMKPDGR